MIGNGCVDRDGSTHAVSNNQDWRGILPVEHLHHFTDIPYNKRNNKQTNKPVYYLKTQQSDIHYNNLEPLHKLMCSTFGGDCKLITS